MQEIDYKREGQSADRFRKNFGSAEWIKVPTVLWERTTSEVSLLQPQQWYVYRPTFETVGATTARPFSASNTFICKNWCGLQVLTMEYCPGTKINRIEQLDAMGVDKQRLARLAVESYLQQILTHGFFHAGELVPPESAMSCISGRPVPKSSAIRYILIKISLGYTVKDSL